MKASVRVFETVTLENLFPRGYILVNPDIKKTLGLSEIAARNHYAQHGHRELRRQITPEFFEWSENSEYKAERFRRFRNCFEALPPNIHHFPISFGDRFENVADYQAESAQGSAGEFVDELTTHPDGLYADIGAGLRDVIFENCLNVEVYPSLTTDVVIEPTGMLPFKTASLNGIGCFAVLEHVRQPWKMAADIARVVKPGGKVFIVWPFLQPTHGYPSHYYNATREGLRALFEPHFQISTLTTRANDGPDFTVQWILSWLLGAIGDPALRAQFAAKTIGEISAELPQSPLWKSILKTLDDRTIEKLSCGNFLAGVRNATAPAFSERGMAAQPVKQIGIKPGLWQRLLGLPRSR